MTPTNTPNTPVIWLMGPTASGKTDLALHLAERYDGEIISVDSALVYRDMNIGTAKPDAASLARVPHHLIDIIEPTSVYSAADFCRDTFALIADIHARGKRALLVGGTMLYFKALAEGLSDLPAANPELRAQLDHEAATQGWAAMHARLAALDPMTAARLAPTDSQRIQRALEVCLLTGQSYASLCTPKPPTHAYQWLKLALIPTDRHALHQRIMRRFDSMLAAGFLDEMRALQKKYPALHPDLPAMRAVGYRQAWQYLAGESNYADFREAGIAATRQLAKRQMTWLRGMPAVHHLDCLDPQLHRHAHHWLAHAWATPQATIQYQTMDF